MQLIPTDPLPEALTPASSWRPISTTLPGSSSRSRRSFALPRKPRPGDGWLLLDEIFLPFLRGREWRSAALLHDRIIATGSLTKVWGLGALRIGWVIAPPEIIYRVQRLMDYLHVVQPLPTEVMAFRVLTGGTGDRLLEAGRSRAEENLQLIKQTLTDWGALDYITPDGGITLFACRRDGRSADSVCRTLLDLERVLVQPGRYFGREEGIRIGFGEPWPIVAEGLRRLRNAYERALESE